MQQPGRQDRGRFQPEPATLHPHYLKDGYFDAAGHLHPGLLTTAGRAPGPQTGPQDSDLDRALSALHHGAVKGSRETGIKVAQLRRFFNRAKQIEGRLRAGESIDEVRAELLRLEDLAAYTVGRGVACEPLLDFMHRNMQYAQLSEKHVRQGFIPHFEAVVAYTTYYWREMERRS
jgi:CRISPR type III-A-associated protein Csm2